MYSGIVAVDSGEVIRVEDEPDKSPIDRSNPPEQSPPRL